MAVYTGAAKEIPSAFGSEDLRSQKGLGLVTLGLAGAAQWLEHRPKQIH